MGTETAYALPEGAAPTGEPQHLGVVPGLYVAGGPAVTLPPDAISADEMDGLIADLELPLEKTEAVSPQRARLEAMTFDELKAEAEQRGVGAAGRKKKDYVDALEAVDVAAPVLVEAPGDPAAEAAHQDAIDGEPG